MNDQKAFPAKNKPAPSIWIPAIGRDADRQSWSSPQSGNIPTIQFGIYDNVIQGKCQDAERNSAKSTIFLAVFLQFRQRGAGISPAPFSDWRRLVPIDKTIRQNIPNGEPPSPAAPPAGRLPQIMKDRLNRQAAHAFSSARNGLIRSIHNPEKIPFE